MLTLRGVVYAHPGPGGFTLGPIDLEGPEDRPWVLLGASGAGKTTLLRLLSGDLSPQAGTIERGSRSRRAYLPQFPERAFGGRNLAEELCGEARPQAEAREALRAALATVGLEGASLARRSTTLSAGERRRAALALLLLSGAPSWGLDEPDAGLDAEGETRLRDLLWARKTTGLWIATRRARIYEDLAPFAVVLNRGKLVGTGEPANLACRPEVKLALDWSGSPEGRLRAALGGNKLRRNVVERLTISVGQNPQMQEIIEDSGSLR